MKAFLFAALNVVALPRLSNAQEHLVPERGQFAEYDAYFAEAREIFATAQKEEVICQVFIPATDAGGEVVIGVRKAGTEYQVFRILPSSRIFDLEVIRMFERGQEGKRDEKGGYPGLADVDYYQKLKKETPVDFRKITATIEAVAVDEKLAQRVSKIWERMLLDVRQPKEIRGGHGVTYHFSMFVLGRGIISGQIWSPSPKTKTAALCDLADEMSKYAAGRENVEALKRTLSRVEKITGA